MTMIRGIKEEYKISVWYFMRKLVKTIGFHNLIVHGHKVYLKKSALLSQSFDYWNIHIHFLTVPNSQGADLWIYRDWILHSFWESKLLLLDTIILTGLLSTKGEILTPLWLLHECLNGRFTMNVTKKGSEVPLDHALEQCYNWPAKVSRGWLESPGRRKK